MPRTRRHVRDEMCSEPKSDAAYRALAWQDAIGVTAGLQRTHP
jgi:hypothetical protein